MNSATEHVAGNAGRVHSGLWSGRGLGDDAIGRTHRVTAVLVCHNGADWLPRCLSSIADSTRRPDTVVAVDTGSTDDSAAMLATATAVDEVVAAEAATGFGDAVARGVAAAPTVVDLTPTEAIEWVWVLHDDVAVAPTALEDLLRASDLSPSATILGPKQRGWHHPELLVECGIAMAPSGRRYTGLEHGDRDQGQRDDLSDVMAVGSAGMLIRRDVWDRLGGFDPELPFFREDIEFCVRAWRADERVVVVPQAVVHHLEAAARGVRAVSAVPLPLPLADRSAALHTALVHTPAWRLPLTSLRLLLGTVLRFLGLLVARAPRRAIGQFRVWGSVHLRPDRVFRARRRVAAVATVPRSELKDLRPSAWERVVVLGDRLGEFVASPVRAGSVTAPLRLGPALVLGAALAVVAALATRQVWAGRGPLSGGALLPGVDGTSLWLGFRSAWHDVGLGSAEPAAAYPLTLLLAAAPPGVSVEFVTLVALLLAVPLAATSMFLALRGIRATGLRVALAVGYGLLPAAIAPSLDGRLGTAAAAVLLPWLGRLLIRIVAAPRCVGALPAPQARTYAMAALLLSVLVSYVPLIWLAITPVLLVAAAVHVRGAGAWLGVLGVIAAPAVLLWPWSGALLADPSRFFFEAGVTSPDLVAADPVGWRLLLLDPGTLGPLIFLAMVPLVVVGLLSLLPAPSRPDVVWLWLVAAAAAGWASVQTSQEFVPVGATTAQHGFAGPMTLLMGGALVAGIAVAAGSGAAAGRRPLAGGRVASAAILAGAALMSWWWITDLTGPLQRSDESPIPAFITEQAVSGERIRTIVLEPDDRGSVAYALVNGRGGQLGDADVAPPAETWQELSAAVGQLVAGVGPEAAATLADNAVRYVVADGGAEGIGESLDANPGLRRLSTSDGRGLWEVLGLSTRARTLSPAGEAPVASLSAAESAESLGTIVSAEVLTEGSGTQLIIAQANDGGWEALVDGRQVPVTGQDRLVVELPSGAPRSVPVTVSHGQQDRDRSLLAPAAGLLVLLVMLLPAAGRARPLADPDEDAADVVDLTDAGRAAAAGEGS